jgi:hypothetical protein
MYVVTLTTPIYGDDLRLADSERHLLRRLARRVAEIAALPIMAQREAEWQRHNRMEPGRPLLLTFPQDAWDELLPQESLSCQSETARAIEYDLRARIMRHNLLQDDMPESGAWHVHKTIHTSGWGLEPRHIASSEARGAWGFDPVLQSTDDLDRLRTPQVTYDARRTARDLDFAQDLLGDILDVQLRGVTYLGYGLMHQFTSLRGMTQTMLDFHDNPTLIHDAMARLTAGHLSMLEQYEAQGLLDLNNDVLYQSSGGLSCTTELPKPGFRPDHVRPCDMWASADAQELAQVGPDHLATFVYPYERELLSCFGLVGYGCCEDLTRKLPLIRDWPNLRRVSISPWADVVQAADILGRNAIFSWKPNPTLLGDPFDLEALRSTVRQALLAARSCVMEIVLKDTMTCHGEPERFTTWSHTVRELIDETR